MPIKFVNFEIQTDNYILANTAYKENKKQTTAHNNNWQKRKKVIVTVV